MSLVTTYLFLFITWFYASLSTVAQASAATPGSNETEKPVEPRIHGGVNAAEREFPFIVRMFRPANPWTMAAGILIDNWHILTVAHFLDDGILPGPHMSIFLGGNELYEPIQTRYVHWFKMHEDYHLNDVLVAIDDIALIRMNRPVDFTKNIRPARIPGCPHTRYSYMNQTITLAGWGVDVWSDAPGVLQRHLKKVNFLVGERGDCSLYDPKHFVCAHYAGHLAGQGDSGGPHVINVSAMFVIGLQTSVLKKVLHSDPHRGFSKLTEVLGLRLDHYLPWIEDARSQSMYLFGEATFQAVASSNISAARSLMQDTPTVAIIMVTIGLLMIQ